MTVDNELFLVNRLAMTGAVETAAERLRARLKKLEWSQLEFATAIGVTPGVVSRWLSGERTPSLEMAFRIERSKVAIPAEAWVTHSSSDESGEHPAVDARRSDTG